MFKARLISIFVLAPVVISMFFLLSCTQFLIFTFVICLIGAWEWGKMMRFPVHIYRTWICVISSLLFCSMITVSTSQTYLYLNNCRFFWYIYSIVIIIWWILALFLILFYPNSAIFWIKSNILRFCFGILIIFPFFLGISILRQFHYAGNEMIGTWWLLYITMLVWINDSSAYIVGKALGRHKLLEIVSPQKTWEGFIGGVLISITISYLFNKYILMSVLHSSIILIYSIVAIIASTIGDLTESMFKREAGIKNSSNLIPGHGGILDRIDSLVVAIPIFTCLILLHLY